MLNEGHKIIDRLINKSILLAVPFYQNQTMDWIREARDIKALDSFVNLSPLPIGFKNLLEKIFEISYFIGYTFKKDFIEKHLAEPFFEIDFDKIGFDEALRILKNKKIVSPQEFKRLMAYFSNIAWSIQKVERLDALIALRKSLLRAIDEGKSLKDWKDEIPGIFENYGITPLSPHHIETVFRTNLVSSYEAASWDYMNDDPNVIAYQYKAVMDARTRDEHADLNDFIAPKDDPIWQKIWPPNGYNCRCDVLPITEYYMNRKNLNFSPINEKIKDALSNISPEFQNFIGGIKGLQQNLKALEMQKESESQGLERKII